MLLAAGVAFYAFLSLVPILVATLSIYGWVSDLSMLREHLGSIWHLMPTNAAQLIQDQLEDITSKRDAALGLTTVLSILVALWSGSAGVGALTDAINTAYDEKETRNWIQLRLRAIVFTFGFVIVSFLSFTLIAMVPALFASTFFESATERLVEVGRWPVLAVLFCGWLAVLYRYGPDRRRAQWKWISPGAMVGTVLWLLSCGLFSLYTEYFGTMGATYGSLAGIVALQLWLYLSALSILVGAEFDSELEHQTLEDSTRGKDRPMGNRGAVKADTVPAT